MAEYWKLVILFIIGIAAGIINVNAGGGSSITLPALIFMGLDSAVANGTNRIGILVQTFFSVASFRKQKHHEFRKSLTLVLFALPGAVAGALISVRLSDDSFKKILGFVMIAIVLTILFSGKKNRTRSEKINKKKEVLIYPAMVAIGFYGGFIQIGVGFLLIASLYHILKLSLVKVNMHKVFIILIYTIPALLVFIITKNIDWKFGVVLASGMALGGWWGAKIVVIGGEKIIKYILAFAVFLMSIKLLLF